MSANIHDAIVAFLEAEELTFIEAKDATATRVAVTGKSGRWFIFSRVDEEQQTLAFYGTCPLVVPQARRGDVLELIGRINYELVLGNFEMNLDDGDIRFRTSTDLENIEDIAPLIERLFYSNVAGLDAYLPAIARVIHDSVDPVRALLDLETDESQTV